MLLSAEKVLFFPSSFNVFIMEVLYFVKRFLYQDDHMGFFLHSIKRYIMLIEIVFVFYSCIVEVNLTWSWCLILLVN